MIINGYMHKQVMFQVVLSDYTGRHRNSTVELNAVNKVFTTVIAVNKVFTTLIAVNKVFTTENVHVEAAVYIFSNAGVLHFTYECCINKNVVVNIYKMFLNM